MGMWVGIHYSKSIRFVCFDWLPHTLTRQQFLIEVPWVDITNARLKQKLFLWKQIYLHFLSFCNTEMAQIFETFFRKRQGTYFHALSAMRWIYLARDMPVLSLEGRGGLDSIFFAQKTMYKYMIIMVLCGFIPMGVTITKVVHACKNVHGCKWVIPINVTTVFFCNTTVLC